METDYSSPVYKVLLEPKLFAGIGLVPFLVIVFATILLANIINMWFLALGILVFLYLNRICKKDPLLLVIFFNRLTQPNVWRA